MIKQSDIIYNVFHFEVSYMTTAHLQLKHEGQVAIFCIICTSTVKALAKRRQHYAQHFAKLSLDVGCCWGTGS